MEKKHFSYEAHVNLAKEEVEEIQEIKFLTSINIVLNSQKSLIASVDLINRQVYIADPDYNNNAFKEAVINFIDKQIALPEDLFEAEQETYDDFDKAQDRQQIIQNTQGE